MRQRLAILAVISLAIAGCSSSDDGSGEESSPSNTKEAESDAQSRSNPKKGTLEALIACAKSAGYDVDRRDANLVAVTGDVQGQLIVERMPSRADAVAASKAADLIESKVVGRLWLKYGNADEGLRNDLDTCALTSTSE